MPCFFAFSHKIPKWKDTVFVHYMMHIFGFLTASLKENSLGKCDFKNKKKGNHLASDPYLV